MNKKTLSILAAILLLVAVPLTLYQMQKQQEIRQRAAVPTFPSNFWNSNLSLSRSNKTTGDIAFCNNEADKCFVYTPTSTDGKEGIYTGPMNLSDDPDNGAPWAGQIAVVWSNPDNGDVAFCSIDAKHCWLWKPDQGYTIKDVDWSTSIFWKNDQSAITTAGRLITWTNYKAKEITFCTPDLAYCWSWSSTAPNTFTKHTDWNNTNIIPWFGKDISLTWSNPRSSNVAFCNNNGTVCYLWQPSNTADGKPGSWSPLPENWNPTLTVTPSPTPVSCEVTQAICRWDDTQTGITRYHVKVTETGSGSEIFNGWVNHPTAEYVFPASPDKTYKCDVYAENECGPGPTTSATTTCPGVSITPTPTSTPTPTPTLTPVPPTLTPTLTPRPTATPTPTPTPTPTETPAPTLTPTATPTGIPIPTSTPVPTSIVTSISTSTPIPVAPTFTPTPTPVQYIAQVTPRPTLPPTGDSKTTIMLGVGGIILTIIGGLLLFIL